MPKYIVKRKDVCAGSLVKSLQLTYKIGDKELLEKSNYKFYRGMLFDVNDDGLTNDLIYNTLIHYPVIENFSSTSSISDFVVCNYVNLEDVLKYMKYNIDLTQSDLNGIYRRLIINNWWLTHHKKIFGLETQSNVICRNDIGIISSDIYDKLNIISRFGNGKPHIEEGYSLIKKRK